ncbi:DUF3822 family protein [Lewinella sp. 4G2]|uniref:DUF3822 family protein n=1 Tax=Lewinella sp. 4G2 TaxID=1803372 RepID=UPI0007B4D0F4|nr:DUF3822 family protein [Lewinella sp. 4G2]OAV44188.1 hypothetical protein A3850_006635 [Lewinella sp. 4G2]
MELDNYNLQSAAFRPEDAQRYELSILTGVDSFAYTIRDRQHNRLLAYSGTQLSSEHQGDLPAAVQGFVDNSPQLSTKGYGNVILGWSTPRVTLVPRELYLADDQRTYLEQLTLLGLEDAVLEEWYNDLDAHLLFAVNKDRLEAVSRSVSTLHSRHLAGGLLSAWRTRSLRRGEAAVSVNIRGRQLFVAAHRAGSLQFFNTFEVTSREDALYYVLLAYEHCGMLPDRHPLYVSGEISERGEIYQLLYTYVRDIHFSALAMPPVPAAELVDLPQHVYFDLLCLS